MSHLEVISFMVHKDKERDQRESQVSLDLHIALECLTKQELEAEPSTCRSCNATAVQV